MKYQYLLDILKKHSPHSSVSMDAIRLDFGDFYAGFQQNVEAVVEKTFLNGDLPAFWIRNPDIEPRNCMLFFHGGGFTIGSTRDHMGLCSRLSHAAETRVLSVDYRLAPEHRFPAALNDCLLAYNTLLDDYNPAQIVVAGISAGGNLVLSMLLALREKGIPLPIAAVAMSPAVDILFEGKSVRLNKQNDWILPERLANLREQYLGDKNPRDPLVSPIYADLAGLPPLLIQVGTHELLLDDIRRFVSKLKSQGGVVEYKEWENMFHCWHIFASEVLEGREAISEIGEFTLKAWNI